MRIIADLHIHSRFSRATSKDMNIVNLERYGKLKGVNLIGTGDFTHPAWLAELKETLKPAGDTGLFNYTNDRMFFALSAEISLIYSAEGKLRKIHNVLLAPSFEVVDQINEWLGRRGNLAADGRPVFGKITCPEFVEAMAQISPNIMIIPAHCLLPSTPVHTNPHIKNIIDIKVGDFVLTHKGRFRKVTKTFRRDYCGKMYKIVPWYFSEGLLATEEHPFLAIKSVKRCPWTKGLCKSLCSKRGTCKKKHFRNYRPAWIPAKGIDVGDFLVFPRFNKIKAIENLQLSKMVSHKRPSDVKDRIKINKDFCRLIGYYISVGYVIRNGAIGFSFGSHETEYIDDVKSLMARAFGITKFKVDKRGETQSDMVFYSHVLNEFFKKAFYCGSAKAHNKCLPKWLLELPKEMVAEVLRGWWRGDLGSTVSKNLANQMKLICLKLGIIPSISITTAKELNKYPKRIGERRLTARHDCYNFTGLSFFEDNYGMLGERCFKRSVNKLQRKHGWIDQNYAYLPVRKIESYEHKGEVFNLEVEGDNSYVTEFAAVHNCWTPWFSLFGSMSGFDRIDDCFQDQTKRIFAIETGLSSDPAMNWRLSQLDRFALVSNSDCHSYYPWRLGREANVFEIKPEYRELIEAIKRKDPKRFLFTVETNPAYGKYHFDGHRLCGVVMSPKEAAAYKNICPVCRRPLTLGVEHRVEELADRSAGFVPPGAIPFKSLLPLSELIAGLYNAKLFSKAVFEAHSKLVRAFGNELAVLLDVAEEKLKAVADDRIAAAIMANRAGAIAVQPGYDGVYGRLLFDESQRLELPKIKRVQRSLADFANWSS